MKHFPVIARAAAPLLLVAVMLPACSGRSEPPAPLGVAASEPAIDQANLCEVNHYGLASQCKRGQKIVFLPKSFGNQQLPIFFAAVNCDLRYAVALTEGAVTCIYGPITPRQAADAAPAPASAPSRP